MWGVNLPLGFFMGAQEAVLRDFYIGQGLTPAEVDAFISGPAFLPWQRMGNMQVSLAAAPARRCCFVYRRLRCRAGAGRRPRTCGSGRAPSPSSSSPPCAPLA